MTMTALWGLFEAEYAKSCTWMRANGFVSDPQPNVEELADVLEIAALEWKRVGAPKLKELKSAQADLHRAFGTTCAAEFPPRSSSMTWEAKPKTQTTCASARPRM